MDIALFTLTGRMILGGVVVVAGLVALAARRRPGRAAELVSVVATIGALAALFVLAAEQLVALTVTAAAPEDVAFNEWRWVLAAPWGRAGIAVGIGVAALTLVLGALGTRRERLSRRALLIGLRGGACAAALVMFIEPALELRHVTREPNHIAVLIDDSRSMELAEKKGGPTRAARAAAIVARSGATFERWRDQHIIDFFTFSDTLAPSSEAQAQRPLPGRADATLLREALEGVRTRYDSHDLAGVVLISDGTPTGRLADGVEDGATQDFLSGLGARVHTVWAGAEGLSDLAVARVIADDFAFVRTAVKVEAVVRATGLAGELEVPVTLRRDGQLVKEQTVRVGGNVPEARVLFELVPERVGKYVYEVAVPVLENEAVVANNTRAFVMRVTRDKTRVLQVSGRPSWDERALRSYFKSDPNVDLISFFILRTHESIQIVPTEELSLIPFPTQELFEQELGSFDVIFLQDFDFRNHGIAPYLDNIRAYVEDGGGLAMIGGDRSFSTGGYFGTPVADALPVELTPAYDPERLISSDPVQARLTEEGVRHPITQLRFDRRDNAARWAGLPPLEGLNLVPGVKPSASVLLEAAPPRGGRSAKAAPVLVAGEYGKGRAVALLTDSAWKWGFVAAGRDGDDGRAYAKLMDNTVRWLIRDPELDYLHVESDQSEYRRGIPARLRARLTDKDYKPAGGQEVIFEVVPAAAPPQKNRSVKIDPLLVKSARTDDGGVALVEAPELPAGSYRVVGRAKLGDRWVTADDVFVVNPEREELEHPGARQDVLAGLARITGGEYLGAAAALDADLPFAPPRVVRVDRRSDIELWSRPHLLFLALAFLAAEWALRRRRGFL